MRSDRDDPLDTAGDRCLLHAGGTAGEDDDDRQVTATAPAVGRVRLVVGDLPPRGQDPEGLAADLAGCRRFVNSPGSHPPPRRRSRPATVLALLHEALSELLDLATVLGLAGLFLDLLGELLALGALGEVLGPLEE